MSTMRGTEMTIPALHTLFCSLTGRDLTLDYLKESCWSVWMRYRKHEPFTEEDLRLVVRFLRHQIKAGERKEASLKFQNLITSPDWFEQDLQDARAWAKRAVPAPPRALALRSIGREEKVPARPVHGPKQNAETVAKLLENLKRAVL